MYHNFSNIGRNIQQRELQSNVNRLNQTMLEYGTQKVPFNLEEKGLPGIEGYDKIFCSVWLDGGTILAGTKTNTLLLWHTHSQTKHIRGFSLDLPPSRNQINTEYVGMHCISVNPSRTLLATGGENPNDIAIFSLPSLTPICVLEGHEGCLFDCKWLSDSILVSGSKDTTLRLWKIRDTFSTFPWEHDSEISQFQINQFGEEYPSNHEESEGEEGVEEENKAMEQRTLRSNRPSLRRHWLSGSAWGARVRDRHSGREEWEAMEEDDDCCEKRSVSSPSTSSCCSHSDFSTLSANSSALSPASPQIHNPADLASYSPLNPNSAAISVTHSSTRVRSFRRRSRSNGLIEELSDVEEETPSLAVGAGKIPGSHITGTSHGEELAQIGSNNHPASLNPLEMEPPPPPSLSRRDLSSSQPVARFPSRPAAASPTPTPTLTPAASVVSPVASVRRVRPFLSATATPGPGSSVRSALSSPLSLHPTPDLFYDSPIMTKFEHTRKVRALTINRQSGHFATLSADGQMILWDSRTIQKVQSLVMPHNQQEELVCLECHPEYNIYAVGSRDHVTLIDPRAVPLATCLQNIDHTMGVRSLAFNNNILSTGIGSGKLAFFDLHAGKYLTALSPDPKISSHADAQVSLSRSFIETHMRRPRSASLWRRGRVSLAPAAGERRREEVPVWSLPQSTENSTPFHHQGGGEMGENQDASSPLAASGSLEHFTSQASREDDNTDLFWSLSAGDALRRGTQQQQPQAGARAVQARGSTGTPYPSPSSSPAAGPFYQYTGYTSFGYGFSALAPTQQPVSSRWEARQEGQSLASRPREVRRSHAGANTPASRDISGSLTEVQRAGYYMTGKGYLRDDMKPTPHAVYTHTYDSSRTRIFVGGGPLQMGYVGCYAGLWE